MKQKYLQGIIKRHPDGFGFFIPEDTEHPDVYIPRHSMKGVMTGDRVMIEAFQDKRDKRFNGEIVKVLTRGTKNILGTFHQLNETRGIVKDEGKGWGEDLKIDLRDSPDVKEGELVTAEITSYPGEAKGFAGRIKTVIGSSADPLTDTKRVLIHNNIPHEFPDEVESEAKEFTEHVEQKDMQGRKNLRELHFITIDGATAKDFDDAIYVELQNQGFKLYVAIADVSHYVRPGSAIDKEAYIRGTSVYFPNFVVPMLPEILSNGLCSLNPHLPRLSLVAEMDFDFTGEMTHSKFYEAVIESKARVTYGEAQEIIDGNPIEKLNHVKSEILRASDLAKILMAKRFREGSLDLEIPEVQIILDATGIPSDFLRSERLFAHRLIEEMMLAANVAVAKFLSSQDVPAIYRIHDSPHAEAIELLERYLETFGGSVPVAAKGKLQKRLTKALQQFEGRPEAQVLNILALRSMNQAKYSADNIGHFGLGFDFYTHFTSPIRRYPDLIVHRLIKNQILKNSDYKPIGEDELQSAATMLSACEQRSVKAERQFVSIKKARFMQQHLGEEFEGIVSSVTKFGVFVLLRQYEVDGLIRVENLSKEKLNFDEDRLVLVGHRSGMTFSIGDQIRIQVSNTDPDQGQVDFELVEVLKHIEEPLNVIAEPNYKKEKPSKGSGKKEHIFDRKKLKNKKHEQRDEKSDRGNFKVKDHRKDKKEKRQDKNKGKPKVQFSQKLKAQKHVEDKSEKQVIEYLDKAQDQSKTQGQKFDPEKHLQMVLKKWKERNGITDRKPAAKSSHDISDRGNRGGNGGGRSNSKGKKGSQR